MRKARFGGGWQAIRYSLRAALRLGPIRFYKAMNAKNACKTCAFGMGGQLGGMRNEAGKFPEVCKKSMQAMAADMAGKIEPRLFATYSIDELKSFSSREMEAFGRLGDPVIVRPGDDRYRPISWDEAIDHIVGSLMATTPNKAFFYASGRSSSEAGFLMQLFARAYGTNHVNNCSFYCHQASGVGLKDSIGVGTATIELDDLEKCDLVFVIGGNPASNHPRFMTMLMKLRRRGGRVIIVNPLRETGLVNFKVPSNLKSMLVGDEIASLYSQPTIGGDIAFLAGMAKRLISLGAIDKVFIDEVTEGFSAVRTYVEELDWQEIEASSGVPRADIEAAADEYARSERTIFAWTMGITHHEHGVQNVQWIANLALMRGMVGKEGCGLLPIRGHSNVQGMGSVGVTPALSKAALDAMQELGFWTDESSTSTAESFRAAGYDTMAAMEACGRGEMSFGLCLGGNLFGSNPDAAFTSTALSRLDTLVYLSTSLNTGHAHGLAKTTLILPVLVRDEESQGTTQESMFSYVRLSDGGKPRFAGPRSETEILSAIADRWNRLRRAPATTLEWQKLADHEEIRRLIARFVPNLSKIGEIGKTKQEFQIPGRILHDIDPTGALGSRVAEAGGGQVRPDSAESRTLSDFPTPTGRAVFRSHPLPNLAELGENELRLMTIRSEGQFNTVVYEEEDPYRGQERRNVILMNDGDIRRLGLLSDQVVTVRSVTGEMPGILVRAFDVAKGCAAMYYPEANRLIAKTTDPRSKTPAFKSVIVTIHPELDAGPPAEAECDVELAARQPSTSRGRMKSC